MVRSIGWVGSVAALTVFAGGSTYAQQVGNRSGGPVLVGSPSQTVPSTSQPMWGTTAESAVVIQATQMQPPDHTVGYSMEDSPTGVGMFQSTSGSSPDWWLGFQIPSGAQLTRAVVEACDTTSEGQHSFGLTAGIAPGVSAQNISPIVQTGLVETPGCAFYTVTPTNATFANNQTQNFWLFNGWLGTGTAFSAALNLRSIRVYYRLQVSPAPATATFADVAVSHPFHRFIEALAASGITGGCGGGNYCPDSPITRGQMAVFLATALGLHFPN